LCGRGGRLTASARRRAARAADAVCDFGLQPFALGAAGGAVHTMVRVSSLFDDDDRGCARQLRRKCI
jgi:hypothetical protein